MGSAIEKSLAILDYLASRPEGATLAEIANALNQMESGCHRALAELIRMRYVRPLPQRDAYALTTKLVSTALGYLSKSGVVDVAQPVIDLLAHATAELVRLAIVDGEKLTVAATAQGARSGLIYEPQDTGVDLRLSCSAAGQAWLMTLPEDIAARCVARQGIGMPDRYGPAAPRSVEALMRVLDQHRERRFSMTENTCALGLSALAAPIQRAGMPAMGVIVIAGPSSRLTSKRMQEFGPALLAVAGELAATSDASALMKSSNAGTWGDIAETPATAGEDPAKGG